MQESDTIYIDVEEHLGKRFEYAKDSYTFSTSDHKHPKYILKATTEFITDITIIGNFLYTSSHYYLRVYATTERKYIGQLNIFNNIEDAPYYRKLYNWNNKYLIALRSRAVEVWEAPNTALSKASKSKTITFQCLQKFDFGDINFDDVSFNCLPLIAFNSELLYVYYGNKIMIINLPDPNKPYFTKKTTINSKELNSLVADETSLWFGTNSGIIYQLSTKFSDDSEVTDNPKIIYNLLEKGYQITSLQKNDYYLVADVCKGNQIMVWDLTKINEYRVIICPGCVQIRLHNKYLICGAGVFFCLYFLGDTENEEKRKKIDLTKPIVIGGAQLKPLLNLAVSSNMITSFDKCGCIYLT